MRKEQTKTKLGKRLAVGVALVNGANTFAPMALLYVQPGLADGGQQLALNQEQPVAARVSASADRKPYSCTDLQNLAYAAMSAVDNAVVTKAEAATYTVSGGTTTSVTNMSNGDTMFIQSGGSGFVGYLNGGVQGIYQGGTGTAEAVMDGGTQLVSGTAVNTVVNKGGKQILYGGGVLSSNTFMGGIQIISSGGTLIADNPSASTLTTQAPDIYGGTQIVSNGGTASGFILRKESSIGGIQRIKSGGTAIGTQILSDAYQSVDSGGVALSESLTSLGHLSMVSGARVQLDKATGGYVDMNGGGLQYGKDAATTTQTYDTDIFVGNDGYAGSGTIVLGHGWGSSASVPGNTLNIVIVNGNYDFMINTDVNKGLNDRVNVKTVTETSESRIGVNFDPVFDPKNYGNYFPDKRMIVATGPLSIKFKPLTTEIGAVRLTPWLQQNGMQWLLTGFSKRASTTVTTTASSHEVVNQVWYNFANSLSKRLGDLRLNQDDSKNGIWARYMRGTDRAGRGSKSELNSNLMQVGYDHAFAVKNGTRYLGLAVDHLNGSTEYERGSGKAKGTSVALYTTWLGKTGHYYDVILRQGHFANDYNVTDLSGVYSSGDYGVNATTLSGEYGYRKNLSKGLYFEPQGEIILGRLSDADYKTSTNWPVHVDSQNHFLTRLGVAVGRETAHSNWYGRASYYHDFGGASSISFDGYGYDSTALRDWVELTLGGDVKLSKSVRIYGEVTKYLGDLTNNVNFNAGLRWSF